MRSILLLMCAWFGLGMVAEAQDRAKAEQLCEQAMDLVYEREEEVTKEIIQKAIELYQEAIEADDSYSPAYEQVAIEYWSIGERDLAFAALAKGMEKVSNGAMFYLLRGIFLEDSEKIEEANQCYKEAAKLFDRVVKEQKSFDLIFYRALTYYLLQNQEVAIAKYQEAIDKRWYPLKDYEEFYEMQMDFLENMDLMDFIHQSITDKYGLKNASANL